MDIQRYIYINPEVRFGKPCLVATRITVGDVLRCLAAGMSYDEILDDFPELTVEHIRVSLLFAARREELVKIILNGEAVA